MSDYLVTDTELTSIADAIRTKGGTSATLSFPTEFVSAINAIATGSTGKQVACGTYNNSANVSSGYVTIKTLADLGFTPKIITLFNGNNIANNSGNGLVQGSLYLPSLRVDYCEHIVIYKGYSGLTVSYGGYNNDAPSSAGYVGVKDGAIQFYASSSYVFTKGTWYWMAIEA